MANNLLKTFFLLGLSLVFVLTNTSSAFVKNTSLIIHVGTPGDYLPYSHFNPETNRYEGLDIDLIENFAQANKLKIIYVPTTWQRLLSDLNNNQFNIGVGGITSTEERKRKASLTQPYNTSQKVLLYSCNQKFKTLTDIDKSTITVVENIGGTNEKFAKENIKQANLIFTKDNNQVFNILLNHQADVMITDSEEALWAHKNNTELCVRDSAIKGTKSTKVFMVNKNNLTLLKKLNIWFKEMKTTNSLQKIKLKWLE